MIVRCGRCRTAFDAPGPGRYECPACGTANDVRSRGPEPGLVTPPPPPPASPPSPRVTCPHCEFRFIVGRAGSVPCPNCRGEVPVAEEGTA